MSELQKPLRIGILLRNRHDGPGGLEKVLDIIAKAAPSQNIELYFYGLFKPNYSDFIHSFKNISYLDIPKGLRALEGKLPRVLFRALHKAYVRTHGDQLFNQIGEDKIDALITMDLAKQFLQNFGFIKRFKEKFNIPVFSWIHLSLTGSRPQTAKKVKEKIAIFDAHLAISHGISNELKEEYHAKNVFVVYNPVDKAPLIPRNKNQFIYVGRISDIKRVDSLLAQLKNLEGKWQLDIFGSTGNSTKDAEFQKYIEHLELTEHVTFHGWCKDPWGQIENAGVTLLNSTREGLPLIIIESMMRGIPVLSTDCPTGPRDLINVGKNGWLYPVDEEDQSREYLQKILDGKLELPSPEKVQQSVQNYETENYLRHLVMCIEQVIK